MQSAGCAAARLSLSPFCTPVDGSSGSVGRRKKSRPPPLKPVASVSVQEAVEVRLRRPERDAALVQTLEACRAGSFRGAGVFGEVHTVPHPTDPAQQVAVKSNRNREAFDTLLGEARAAMAFNHARLLHYRGFACRREPPPPVIHVYMDAMESSLSDLVGKQRLSPRKTLGLLRDIAEGLEELHRQQQVHNDIKADNILVNKEGRAVIGDFGRTQPGLAHLDGISPLYPPEMEPFSPRGLALSDAGGSQESGSEDKLCLSGFQGRIDMYGLGYIGLQLLSGESFPEVWSSDACGRPVSHMTRILERLLKDDSQPPLARDCLHELIVPCLDCDMTRRPDAPEAIRLIDSLLASGSRGHESFGGGEDSSASGGCSGVDTGAVPCGGTQCLPCQKPEQAEPGVSPRRTGDGVE